MNAFNFAVSCFKNSIPAVNTHIFSMAKKRTIHVLTGVFLACVTYECWRSKIVAISATVMTIGSCISLIFLKIYQACVKKPNAQEESFNDLQEISQSVSLPISNDPLSEQNELGLVPQEVSQENIEPEFVYSHEFFVSFLQQIKIDIRWEYEELIFDKMVAAKIKSPHFEAICQNIDVNYQKGQFCEQAASDNLFIDKIVLFACCYKLSASKNEADLLKAIQLYQQIKIHFDYGEKPLLHFLDCYLSFKVLYDFDKLACKLTENIHEHLREKSLSKETKEEKHFVLFKTVELIKTISDQSVQLLAFYRLLNSFIANEYLNDLIDLIIPEMTPEMKDELFFTLWIRYSRRLSENNSICLEKNISDEMLRRNFNGIAVSKIRYDKIALAYSIAKRKEKTVEEMIAILTFCTVELNAASQSNSLDYLQKHPHFVSLIKKTVDWVETTEDFVEMLIE